MGNDPVNLVDPDGRQCSFAEIGSIFSWDKGIFGSWFKADENKQLPDALVQTGKQVGNAMLDGVENGAELASKGLRIGGAMAFIAGELPLAATLAAYKTVADGTSALTSLGKSTLNDSDKDWNDFVNKGRTIMQEKAVEYFGGKIIQMHIPESMKSDAASALKVLSEPIVKIQGSKGP